MNGIDFIADTNVLIYALEGHSIVSGITDCSLAISFITEIELLGKKGLDANEAFAIRRLLEDCTIIPLNNDIKEITIALKQEYSIKIPDAIIAATSIFFELPLVTADTDFKNIRGVDLILISH